MKNFTMIFLLAIALLVSTGTVIAQNSVDVEIDVIAGSPLGLPLKSSIPIHADIILVVYIEKLKASTGVTVTAELPEGVTPQSVTVSAGQEGSCAFEGSSIVCNFPKLGYEGRIFRHGNAAVIGINLQPGAAGLVNVSASITANELDPDPANNSKSASIEVIGQPAPPKPRKRVRFF
jgi:hypothetical protein